MHYHKDFSVFSDDVDFVKSGEPDLLSTVMIEHLKIAETVLKV